MFKKAVVVFVFIEILFCYFFTFEINALAPSTQLGAVQDTLPNPGSLGAPGSRVRRTEQEFIPIQERTVYEQLNVQNYNANRKHGGFKNKYIRHVMKVGWEPSAILVQNTHRVMAIIGISLALLYGNSALFINLIYFSAVNNVLLLFVFAALVIVNILFVVFCYYFLSERGIDKIRKLRGSLGLNKGIFRNLTLFVVAALLFCTFIFASVEVVFTMFCFEFLALSWILVLIAIPVLVFSAIIFIAFIIRDHLSENISGYPVVRLSKEFASSRNLEIDEGLISQIDEFESSKNVKVQFVSDSDLLSQLSPDGNNLFLNIGWILKDRQENSTARRANYLKILLERVPAKTVPLNNPFVSEGMFLQYFVESGNIGGFSRKSYIGKNQAGEWTVSTLDFINSSRESLYQSRRQQEDEELRPALLREPLMPEDIIEPFIDQSTLENPRPRRVWSLAVPRPRRVWPLAVSRPRRVWSLKNVAMTDDKVEEILRLPKYRRLEREYRLDDDSNFSLQRYQSLTHAGVFKTGNINIQIVDSEDVGFHEDGRREKVFAHAYIEGGHKYIRMTRGFYRLALQHKVLELVLFHEIGHLQTDSQGRLRDEEFAEQYADVAELVDILQQPLQPYEQVPLLPQDLTIDFGQFSDLLGVSSRARTLKRDRRDTKVPIWDYKIEKNLLRMIKAKKRGEKIRVYGCMGRDMMAELELNHPHFRDFLNEHFEFLQDPLAAGTQTMMDKLNLSKASEKISVSA